MVRVRAAGGGRVVVAVAQTHNLILPQPSTSQSPARRPRWHLPGLAQHGRTRAHGATDIMQFLLVTRWAGLLVG